LELKGSQRGFVPNESDTETAEDPTNRKFGAVLPPSFAVVLPNSVNRVLSREMQPFMLNDAVLPGLQSLTPLIGGRDHPFVMSGSSIV
jgi:hypothetical protein